MDSYEEMITPEVPKALPNEQLFIYVPIASDDTPGVAKFDSEYFSVDTDGMVSLRSICRCGRISIPRDQWTDGSPTKALIEVPGVDVGSVIIMLPADDDTRLIANRARLSAYPVAFTPLDGVSSVTILRSDAEMVPERDMTFVYLILKTGVSGNPIAGIVGVDAYGEVGGTASGVDEEAVKALIGKEVPEWARAKQKPTYTPEEVKARPATWTPTAEEIGARPSTWMPTAEEVGARPNTWTPTAKEVGADSAAAEKVQNHNEDSGSHTDIRVDITTIRNILAGVIGTDTGKSMRAVATLVVAEIVGDASDSFDTLEEIAAWIEAHPNDVAAMVKRITDLETAMGGKVSKTDIINTLDSTALDKPLSAAMGARLKTLLEEMSDELDGKTTPEQVTAQIKTALTPYITKEEADKTYQAAGDYASGDHNHDGTYAKPSDIPTVPTKVSQLTNDSGYINQHQSIAHLLPKNQGVANAGKLMMVAADGSVTYIDIADLGLSRGDVTGVMREGNYIDLTGDIAKGTYTLTWTDDKGNTYDAGSLTVGEMYTVTANLTNCTISNTGRVLEGRSYTATVTPDSGHEITSITVTMGGNDITGDAVNGEEISIASVTGDVTITAVAAEKAETYTILSYAEVGAEPGEVDTGYVATAKTGFAISFAATITGTASGTRYNNGFCGNKAFSIGMVTDNARAFKGSVKSFELFKDSDTADHVVKLNYNGDGACEIDGATKGWNTGGSDPTDFTETLRIFSAGTHSTLSKGARYLRVYEYVITENGSVVRTLKPCKRGKDGNIGFYDTVNGVFYPSTGSVTGGAVVEEISL